MSLRKAAIAFAIILAGCGSAEIRPTATAPASDQAPTISLCAIVAHPEPFIGKVTIIRARYSVVKHYDSFFSGVNCPAKSVIAEGSRKDSGKSVSEFNRAGDRLCKTRKIESLCALEADLVVEVRIRRDTDGELVADPIRVENFTYLPAKEKQKAKRE